MSTNPEALDLESIRREIARVAPECETQPITRLGEGMDSLAVLVSGDLVFRFSKRAEVARRLRREIALLPCLAPQLSCAIPQFKYVATHSHTALPFVGYPLIPGEPLRPSLYENLPVATKQIVLTSLAAFLTAIHAFPVDQAIACGVPREGDRAGMLNNIRRARDDVFPRLPECARHHVERELERFVADDANFDFAPTLLHADLGPQHLLFSPTQQQLAGIIDFGDMSLGDPDFDFALLARRFGLKFLANLLRHHCHPNPTRLADKARAYSLNYSVENVFLGLEHSDEALINFALADLIKHHNSAAEPLHVP